MYTFASVEPCQARFRTFTRHYVQAIDLTYKICKGKDAIGISMYVRNIICTNADYRWRFRHNKLYDFNSNGNGQDMTNIAHRRRIVPLYSIQKVEIIIT